MFDGNGKKMGKPTEHKVPLLNSENNDAWQDVELDLPRTHRPFTRNKRKFLLIGIAATIVCLVMIATISFLDYHSHGLKCDPTRVDSIQGYTGYDRPIVKELPVYKKGAVAADCPRCSEIGRDILEAGGSAVDAAISTLLCQGVINSFASGIGGGGFMLIRSSTGQEEVIDFREVAPENAFRDMYQEVHNKSQFGGLAAGVPGELRGFEVAHKRHGKLPWRDVVLPAARLASGGFVVTKTLANMFKSQGAAIMANKDMRLEFAPNGVLPVEGDVLQRPRLGRTLEIVAEHGADALYNGTLTEGFVRDVNSQGGNMTVRDLNNYTPVIREVVSSRFGGYRVIAAPAPASGQVLLYTLNVLGGFNATRCDAATIDLTQRVVETFKFAYAKRTQLADPAYYDVTDVVALLGNTTFADETRGKIKLDRTFPLSYYGPSFDVEETPGTTHVSVLGPDNDAVAVTSTINLSFGSQIVSGSTGIVVNNEMDDFSSPNITNAFGVRPSKANFITPGKRPLSSSAPVIVISDTGRVRLVAGASGGTRITTATAQVVLGVLSLGMDIKEAIDAQRVHHQLLPANVTVEPQFSPELIKGLQKIGHSVVILKTGSYESVVQGVEQRADGTIYAYSDPRKGGVAAGF
eukprot:Colp12_sorted_trinity150504_noHs@31971